MPFIAEYAIREPVGDTSHPVVQLCQGGLVASSNERNECFVGEMGVLLPHGEAVL